MIPPPHIQSLKLLFGNQPSLCLWRLNNYNRLLTSLQSLTILNLCISLQEQSPKDSTDHITVLFKYHDDSPLPSELNSHSAYQIRALESDNLVSHFNSCHVQDVCDFEGWPNLLSLGFLMGKKTRVPPSTQENHSTD